MVEGRVQRDQLAAPERPADTVPQESTASKSTALSKPKRLGGCWKEPQKNPEGCEVRSLQPGTANEVEYGRKKRRHCKGTVRTQALQGGQAKEAEEQSLQGS